MEPALNNVVRAVESTRRALDSVARNQAQLVDHDDFHSLEEIGNVLTPLESAKLDVAVAYSIASLYFVLLRAEVRCCARFDLG